MKKILTLFLVFIGCVSTANATDYYIGANTDFSEGNTKWEIKGQMLDNDGDGTYSLIIQVPTHQVYNETTYYYDFYFNIFTGSSIDWSNAYRPTGDTLIKGNEGGDEITMDEDPNANNNSIQYPIDWNDYDDNLVRNYASALKIDYTPSTHKLKVTRLIAVATANNSYSTTTDYLTETANGSKIYKGRVALDNFKIVCNQYGYQYWGRKKYTDDDGYMTNDAGDDVSVTPGVYDVTADLSTFLWQDPVRVTATASVGSYGMATLSSEYALDFTDTEEVKAYTITAADKSTGELTKTPVTGKVAAGTGLYIEGDADASAEIPTTIYTTATEGNMLVAGTGAKIDQTTGDYTNFILTVNKADETTAETPKFFKVNTAGNTVPAGKAYLQILTANAAREFFWFDDDVTAINAVTNNQNMDGQAYNLAGQRIAQPTKGLYIVNGKKYIVK
ncbi:MAG: hypothetical protein IJU11_04260 [Prevotella sp.]|nr:hypothetical protein [Prevotella sp.]